MDEDDVESIVESAVASMAVKTAEDLIRQILALARQLTPEGWDAAYYYALTGRENVQRWHTMDVGLLREVRGISMMATVRFK